ncbi:MAG: ABC transporter permease [Nitriliruptoraceae bacterium]
MVKILAIVRIELTRLLRDRSNLFFVFAFPLLLVVFIGAQFAGEPETRLGFVGAETDPGASELRAELEAVDGVTVVRFEDADELAGEVDRGRLSAGVVVPEGYGDALAAVEPVELVLVGRPDATASSLQALVGAVVAEQAQPGTAALLLAEARASVEGSEDDPAALRATAVELAPELARIEVTTSSVGVDELAEEFARLGQFDLGASSQLFLFTFLTSLAGSGALIQTRRYGVARRMLSTPTSVTTVLLGTAGGRLAIALFQALYIIAVTRVAFDVNWGDPLATTVVVLLFSLVAAAAAMLVGSVFSNDSQASGAGVGIGLGMAALGGSMVPLEVFPEGVRQVARITPHAWANEAMAELVRRDGTLADILPEVAALAGFAVVLLALGSWTLRRALSR